MLDHIDRGILELLQEDARMSNAAIADALGLNGSTVGRRIDRLEEGGVIERYGARVDSDALGLEVTVFALVKMQAYEHTEAVRETLCGMERVLGVHAVDGDHDWVVKVRAEDRRRAGALLEEELGSIPGVNGMQTVVVRETFKETLAQPVHEDEETREG